MRKVSIVVPVYNVEQYLERCIESICNQSYKNLEVILVNDGSTDQSPQICDKYARKDDRIKVLHKENGGLSDARNVGLSYVTGEYVYFCDSDDYIEKELLSDCMEVMNKQECDIVMFAYYRIQNGFVTVCREDLPLHVFSIKDTPNLLLTSPTACNKIFNTRFLKKADILFPKGKLYEDLGTIPKLYQVAENIVYIDKPYYYYDIREGSIMTATKKERAYTNRIKMIESILEYYKELGLYQKYMKELEFFAFFNGMFLPIRENALKGCKKNDCDLYKKAIISHFPKCFNNLYISKMNKKEKLFVYIIKYGQYWIFPILSKCKKRIKGEK